MRGIELIKLVEKKRGYKEEKERINRKLSEKLIFYLILKRFIELILLLDI